MFYVSTVKPEGLLVLEPAEVASIAEDLRDGPALMLVALAGLAAMFRRAAAVDRAARIDSRGLLRALTFEP
jgi:hypothetical protein